VDRHGYSPQEADKRNVGKEVGRYVGEWTELEVGGKTGNREAGRTCLVHG